MTGANSGGEYASSPPSSPWATPDIVPIAAASLSRSPRLIVLNRTSGGLGFNIVGGENGEGIFVSFVQAGGAADASKDLKLGDQLLSVNGIDLASATHEQAALALKRAGARAELVVAYRPEEYNRFEARIQDLREQMLSSSGGALRTTQKRSLYVRAQFDYDPSKDAGLPNRGIAFRRGDILHVTNASDDEWWQARRVVIGEERQPQQAAFGIIPSCRRVERRERARQRKVNFNRTPAPPTPSAEAELVRAASTLDRKKKSSSLLQKLQLSRGAREQAAAEEEAAVAADAALAQQQQQPQEPRIPTYEPVQPQELSIARPIVLLGAAKEELNDMLIASNPGEFVSCVPHTTRPPRQGEVNGRDYHFVASRQQMEAEIAEHQFAEAGQFKGNLYGTALRSVRAVAEMKRHCVLDVSGNAIGRLEAAGLHPIAILVRVHSLENAMQLKPDSSPEMAKKLCERTARVQADFGHQLTAIVSGNSLQEIFEDIRRVIRENADRIVWIACENELL